MELGQVCPFSLFSFNIVLEVLLVNTIKQVKEIQGTQIRREEIKLSLFTEEMPVYMKNLTDFINMRTHTHTHPDSSVRPAGAIRLPSVLTQHSPPQTRMVLFLPRGLRARVHGTVSPQTHMVNPHPRCDGI